MADKRLVTTGGDYEAGGSVARAFLEGISEFFICFRAKKKTNKQNKTKMSDRYPVRDPLVSICNPPEVQLKYVIRQRVGGDEVVFWLSIKNAALIQWHKIKKRNSRHCIH